MDYIYKVITTQIYDENKEKGPYVDNGFGVFITYESDWCVA